MICARAPTWRWQYGRLIVGEQHLVAARDNHHTSLVAEAVWGDLRALFQALDDSSGSCLTLEIAVARAKTNHGIY